MSERGVFAVDRGIFEHPKLQSDKQPLSKLEAWLWLLASAAWKPHTRRVSGKTFELKRGQLVASTRYMAERWRWTEPRVRRFLASLKTDAGGDAEIDAVTDAGVTVITIRKYNQYQRVSLPTDAPSDAGSDAGTDAVATQERRNKEDMEDKETPEANASGARQPALRAAAPAKVRGTRLPAGWGPDEEGQRFAVETLGSLEEARREFAKFRDHWNAQPGSKGVKTDWPATWRNWCRKAVEIRGNRGPPRGSNTMSFHQIADMIRNQPDETPSSPGFEAATEPAGFDFGEPAGGALRR